ncbi:hypothetical protein GCM10010215_00480 [Streptomyces virginiae]|nr:hypothetical protein GCM10010215_00480 [Streptomyces virginiae]
MSWFESLILGLVQGLTEFLPISSSAHLRLTAAFAGWHDPGAAFTAITQIGTEAAVLIYFRKDIARIISTWFRSLYTKALRSEQDAKMGWLVIVGSLPIGILGLVFKDAIVGPARDLRLTATTLIVMGIVLGIADRLAARDEEGGRHRAIRERKTLQQLGVKDGLIFGFCQAMALIPGVSRSGATISGGLLLGFTREAAARYSFLLAIPAVLASGAFEIKDVIEEPGHISWGPTVFATVIAFFVGYAVIAWFMKFITTKSFMPFVIYRIALGILLFVLTGTACPTPHAGESGSWRPPPTTPREREAAGERSRSASASLFTKRPKGKKQGVSHGSSGAGAFSGRKSAGELAGRGVCGAADARGCAGRGGHGSGERRVPRRGPAAGGAFRSLTGRAEIRWAHAPWPRARAAPH